MRTADQPIRISLIAPNGRMGKAIALAVADEPGFAIDADHGDVLVDFSAPDALQSSLDRAVSAGVPILIGTTGLDESADALIAETARQVAVLRAPNTSLGVTVLAELVRAGGRFAWARMGHRDRRNPSQAEGRRAVGHRAAARPCRSPRPRSGIRSRNRSLGNGTYPQARGNWLRLASRRHRRRRA